MHINTRKSKIVLFLSFILSTSLVITCSTIPNKIKMPWFRDSGNAGYIKLNNRLQVVVASSETPLIGTQQLINKKILHV